MNRFIYTITGIRSKDNQTDYRCYGYFFDLTYTKELVETPHNELDECNYYDYIVIEQFTQRLYTLAKKSYWYKFDKKSKIFNKCDIPEWAKNVINWGLG